MKTCRICHNTGNDITFEVKEMMFGSEKIFHYFECNHCHCLQIENFPDHPEEYYPKDYHSFSNTHLQRYTGLRGKIRLWAINNQISQKHINLDASHKITMYHALGRVGVDKNSKILDVGSGHGYFLYPLSLLGYSNLLSIDPYIKETIRYGSGYKTAKTSLDQMEGLWDVITFCNSFEHIYTPHETLEKTNNLLNPGGHCIISIPVTGSSAWQEYKENWYQIDAPRHFYLHSQKSMGILAQQHGFKVIETIFNSGYTQFYISELYRNGIKMTDSKKHKGNIIRWKIKKHQLTKRAIEDNKKWRNRHF